MTEIHTKYPKLVLLVISTLLAYILFRANFFIEFSKVLHGHGYISVFIAGLLFTYGFTAPLAVGFFVALAPQVNIFVAAPLAGLGALLSDLIIFRFIRSSFMDELERLKLSYIFQKIHYHFENHLKETMKKYFLWLIAGFLIASPLPDEFGVSIVSGFTSINKRLFAVLAFSLNTVGIFLLMLLLK